MSHIDPDAGDGPSRAWFESELRSCRKRIAELEAENAAWRRAFPSIAVIDTTAWPT